MKRKAEIYALCHPNTGEIRYIGKSDDSAKRLIVHIRDARRLNRPVHCWIRKLQTEGLRPVMRVLEVVDDWVEAERRLIARHRANGANLLNVADGGDQPRCTTEQRVANARALNEKLRADDRMSFIQDAKRRLGLAIKLGQLQERTKKTMREAARANPRLFGEWATI